MQMKWFLKCHLLFRLFSSLHFYISFEFICSRFVFFFLPLVILNLVPRSYRETVTEMYLQPLGRGTSGYETK